MRRCPGHFIDGEWVASRSEDAFTVYNPFTESAYGEVAVGSAEDVDAAVRSAHRALGQGAWRDATLEERISVVQRIRDAIVSRADELARVTTSSMGTPYHQYRNLANAAEIIDMSIDMARKVRWEYLRMDASGDSLIARRPVGVVAGIVPWNVPVRSEVKKITPALLAGCTIVLKPAPEAPFGAAILAEICAEAGVPSGVVNVVMGDGNTGELLVRHPLVRKVAFTGSTATGTRIWSAVAESFTRLQLELGGKSAAILLDDVDLARVRTGLFAGIFFMSGQQCTATSRILAPRRRYDEVVALMSDIAAGVVMGDPFDENTTMGPLVAQRQRERVLRYIEIGQAEGARLVCGGGRPSAQSTVWFVEPTVFADVDNSMRIAREEIFGPVAVVIPYDDDADAVRIANDSDYGLGGSVYSTDPHRALAVARRVDSGYVSINRYGIPSSAPFGGVKRSGIGREHGVEGFDSFLEYVSYPLSHSFAQELSSITPIEGSSPNDVNHDQG